MGDTFFNKNQGMSEDDVVFNDLINQFMRDSAFQDITAEEYGVNDLIDDTDRGRGGSSYTTSSQRRVIYE